MEKTTKRLIKNLFVPLLVAAVLTTYGMAETEPDYRLKLSFYDVGQGDAIFIETFLGTQVLLDGGPNSLVLQGLARDLPFWDRDLDMLILSHPHSDHVNGLIEVLKRYRVRQILMPEVESHSSSHLEFVAIAQAKNVEIIFAYEGLRIHLDSATVFDVYAPGPGKLLVGDGQGRANPNDASIVGKLSFGQSQILFTGDIGLLTELQLLPKYNLDSDVLKVAHHGSRYSTGQVFVNEVTPSYSVIQVGRNSYGHPTSEVIDRLQQSGSQLFRTDLHGTIKFRSDGYRIHPIP